MTIEQRPLLFILNDDRTPVPINHHDRSAMDAWRQWMAQPDRGRVGRDWVGPAMVSTIFLSIDHAFGQGTPLLFETMIFWKGGPLNREQMRYSTYDEAEAGHRATVARVRQAMDHLARARSAPERSHP